MDLLNERLGTGVAFPVVPDRRRGGLPLRSGADKVRESIELILRTEPGERIMRPDFGCGLRQFLMEPNSAATRARLERTVTQALEAYEPRVRLDRRRRFTRRGALARSSSPSEYEHRLDRSSAVLVYPFYLDR